MLVIAAPPAKYRIVYYLQKLEYEQPSGIAEGAPGVFYVTADGVVLFSVTGQGVARDLAIFHNPPDTLAPTPVTAANGLIYSSFETGGGAKEGYCSSTVFSVGPTAGSQQNYDPSGYSPQFSQNLPDGFLLGWAARCSDGSFHLVKSDLSGAVTSLYQFPKDDRPDSVLYGSDGNYYGSAGLRDGTGYIYRVTTAGALTKLRSFPAPGVGFLMQASDGEFYGATMPGKSGSQAGTIFKLSLTGQYRLLRTLDPGQGGEVNAMVEASDGNLYGAAGGTSGTDSHLFRISKTGDYTVLFEMANAVTDGLCPCSLIQGSDGILYGVVSVGGADGRGAIFALNANLLKPVPKPLQFQPASGPVGTQVRIWGRELFSASVTFHGAAASGVRNGGPSYVYATVPPGASTGPITVTTPGGMGTTPAAFTVTSK